MAGTTVNVSIRMEAAVKAEAEALFSELGLSFGAAVNVFVRQAVRQGGIPFKVALGKEREKKTPLAANGGPQETAVQAGAQSQPEGGGEYASLEEFFAKLDAG